MGRAPRTGFTSIDLYNVSRTYKHMLSVHNVPAAKHTKYWRMIHRQLTAKY